MDQDSFYLKIESNAFFQRWKKQSRFSTKDFKKELLRENKKEIFKIIKKTKKFKKNNILEIGCFIGDLLFYVKKKYKCKVHGIEPSSKACNFAKNFFNLNLENKTFLRSKLFRLEKKNYQKYDIIICDDVLSWIDRSSIMSTLGVLDWMLKPRGVIFIRDFFPPKSFAYPNHHWPKKKIYNFKQLGGHKIFFINSGKYIEKYSKIYFTKKFQKLNIRKKSSSVWCDTVLEKIRGFSHPIEKIK